MLHIDGVFGGYGEVKVLHDVSIRIKEGAFVALVGSNGAGKTTLLRMISGTIPVTQGKIQFMGITLNRKTPSEILKMGIAQVPEGRGIFSNFSVYDNLLLAAYNRRSEGRTEIEKSIQEECERFPVLGRKIKDTAGTLSGGEQQMLAISMALMSRPKLLLLDEPSVGLAPIIIQEILKSIIKLRFQRNLTVIMAEQMAKRAIEMSDFAFVLRRGQVIMAGETESLMGTDLEQYF